MACITQMLGSICSFTCHLCFAPCGASRHVRTLNATILSISCVVAVILASQTVAEFMQRKVETNAPGIARIAGALQICDNTSNIDEENVFDEGNVTQCIMAWSRVGASRIMWANAVFFAIMFLLTFGVNSQTSCRYGLHSGSWGIKIIAIVLLCFAGFLITPNFFSTKWHWVESTGSMLFSVLQVFVIIRASHAFANRIVSAYEDGKGKMMMTVYIVLVATIYIFCAIVVVFQYRYTETYKNIQHAQAITNSASVILISIISVIPYVRYATPSSGLLQSCIVSLHLVVFSYTTTTYNIDLLVSISQAIIFVFGLVHMCTRSRIKTHVVNLQDDEDENDAIPLQATGEILAPVPSNSKNTAIGYSCAFFYLYLFTASLRVSNIIALASNTAIQSETSWFMIAATIMIVVAYLWSLLYPAFSQHKARAY